MKYALMLYTIFSVPFRLLRPELITYDKTIRILKNGEDVTGQPFSPLCSKIELIFVRNFKKKRLNSICISRGHFFVGNFFPANVNLLVCLSTRLDSTRRIRKSGIHFSI